ncbi:flagellar basal-body MS-ring/collar protein FliF [Clostridium botulinum]|uniref:Flagellar M-ring protein n=2 Tax=Clostridium botulinum TaxID=1491 RepID=A0A846HZ45_CLOBO|nr:flagellar basal-body MS-ring/collar protein FliF [Clostridium botulinum]AJD28794.1 flagellar M-ring protein FliF [Clostridium botulinum CDC_297]ACQ53291.1 flagellar M-ring protein FliF [Clostridium botulinum Ba4 str. 657]AJE09638.1 flagellar M-ring protein FliF [Clostridium botulinum CDC_1436]APR00322.1 flagellar M-ring protein FliF [Clostridium botulinum]APU61608.1 flagellar M-ring protein FliF [Clostridium botulinum]
MNKLKEFFKGLKEKWTGFSKVKKIAFSIIFLGIITSIIALSLYFGKTKYAVLFSNMDSNDSGTVLQKLKDKKVEAKVEGNNILVPKDQVDELRMQMLSEVPLTNGSQGFEILDKSQFGETDQEMKINYQRALQGELERTIKGFPQVDNTRVHLVLPEETAFVKETQPGRASVTLNLKQGQNLSKEQVKSIVALVSGSVKNIPKENVEVIDNNMNLLTKNLFDASGSLEEATTSAEKQQQLQKNYEKDLQNRLVSMLEAVYGKDKVKVNINTDLDFDAVKTNSVTYDPKNVVVSEHSIKEKNQNNAGGNNTNGSVVDNNMVNRTTQNNNGSETSSRDENTKNYEISKTQQDSIKAPGSVKRLTASIVLDGNIDEETRSAVRNLAVSAIGYDEKRGDTINVEGLPFDTAAKDKVKKDLEDMQKTEKTKERIKLFTAIGLGVLLLLGAIIFFIIKKRNEDEEYEDDEEGLDILIDDNDSETKQVPKFKPIDLETQDEKTHVENEIRKYAKDKPDQVAEIIKSWLAEDER